MSKNKNKKTKEEPKPAPIREPAMKRDEEDKSGYRDLAKKFYEIMRELGQGPFVDGIFLDERFKKIGFDLNGNPHVLWRIWRQAEHDFPGAIEFIPQTSTHWRSKPSGWRYVGPPQFERRKKKLK